MEVAGAYCHLFSCISDTETQTYETWTISVPWLFYKGYNQLFVISSNLTAFAGGKQKPLNDI